MQSSEFRKIVNVLEAIENPNSKYLKIVDRFADWVYNTKYNGNIDIVPRDRNGNTLTDWLYRVEDDFKVSKEKGFEALGYVAKRFPKWYKILAAEFQANGLEVPTI